MSRLDWKESRARSTNSSRGLVEPTSNKKTASLSGGVNLEMAEIGVLEWSN
jgi:hypothetical protein